MKRAIAISVLILFVMTGCGGNEQSTGDLITVDVTQSYPEKELILQDIFDVEYILLDDANEEFITNGLIRAIGKEYIIARNTGNSGEILIFDRNGKGLRVINRKGQGPEEYAAFSLIHLDEDHNELFVLHTRAKKMYVYDLFGNFQRTLALDMRAIIPVVDNFDQNNLIFDVYNDLDADAAAAAAAIDITYVEQRFYIMSKKDGNYNPIQIPYEKRLYRTLYARDGNVIASGPQNQLLIPNRDSWVLTEPSSDTIYRIRPDLSLTPIIVRTPSIQSMSPEVFLFPSIITDRYVLMQTVKKEIETETPVNANVSNFTYPRRNLIYDIREKAIAEYTVYNDDFSTKTPIDLAFERYNSLPFLHNEIAFFKRLESFELVDAYQKGQLKGQLKEVAAKLNEESNPVIMLLKHKK